MNVEIVKQTKDLIIINWEDLEIGFGQLTMTANDGGTYTIDSEYMSIEFIIQVIKAIKL